MHHWQILLPGAAGVLILSILVCRWVKRSALRRQRDFTRTLETLLQPKETIQVICPQRGGHCILTNSRILFEKRGNFSAFPLKDIRKLQGKNRKGNRTTAPQNMESLTVTLEKDFLLRNTGEDFETLAALLQEKIRKQRKSTLKK